VLAHHGVHVAGTDFDRRVELVTILRELGYQTLDPKAVRFRTASISIWPPGT
jgi:hypothetical protein